MNNQDEERSLTYVETQKAQEMRRRIMWSILDMDTRMIAPYLKPSTKRCVDVSCDT